MQHNIYIIDLHFSEEFSGLKGIVELTRIIIKTKLDKVYWLVYLLVTLTLILR